MKNFWDTVLTVIIWVCIGCGEIGGIAHSVNKHSTGDVIVSILVPPWAFYRCIESFWHNDFSDTDWNKTLPDDMKSCVYLLNSISQSDANVFEVNKNIAEFSKKISVYPSDKKYFLKRGSYLYIQYVLSASSDFVHAMDQYYDGDGFHFAYGLQTKQLGDSLSNYCLLDAVEFMEKTDENSAKELQDKLRNENSADLAAEKSAFHSKIELLTSQKQKTIKQGYKDIFDDEFK